MRPRRCVFLRGAPDETRRAAVARCAALSPADVLWVSDAPAPAGFEHSTPGRVRRRLGGAFDAVVIDAHVALDADVIGQAHGFVRGGGALVLRWPDAPPLAGRERLAAHPFGPEDVGTRFFARLERHLSPLSGQSPAPLAPADRAVRGTPEQARVVEALRGALAAPRPSATVLLSDRGRGKSSALGLALAGLPPEVKAVVSAPSREAAAELFRFAGDRALTHVAPAALLDVEADVIVVDEAAQIPVPLLRAIAAAHPRARLAFASTAHGYEGTGRGFVLRFVDELRGGPRPLHELTLEAPIRWAPDDPLERAVFAALALDAEPAEGVDDVGLEDVEAVVLHPDALAADERALRDTFGLLVHAHYRTTPSDLQRLLDAPNLVVHGLRARGRIVAATLAAREGALPAARCEAIARGEGRIRGHALPDTLISHAGRVRAGELPMIRSVRIATHPALRRRGLATRLIAHVHEVHAPALFGTLFGVTRELLAFRRSVGYALVRVGSSRGARTGEPSAVMVRPVTPEARALVDGLRVDLAREWPLQRELLDGAGDLRLDPALAEALADGLPAPTPASAEKIEADARAYLSGPRPYEAAAHALTALVEAHRDRVETLPEADAALVRARVLERRPWPECAAAAGQPSVPAAMRALRRALVALLRF